LQSEEKLVNSGIVKQQLTRLVSQREINNAKQTVLNINDLLNTEQPG